MQLKRALLQSAAERLRQPRQQNSQQQDRRTHPRHDIYTSIRWRVLSNIHSQSGQLYNLSMNGALISVKQYIREGSYIHFEVLPDNHNQLPVQVIGNIIRKLHHGMTEGNFMYGCQILQFSDPNFI